MRQRPLEEKLRHSSPVQVLLNTVIPIEWLSALSLSEIVDIKSGLQGEVEQFKDYLWSAQARNRRFAHRQRISTDNSASRKLSDQRLAGSSPVKRLLQECLRD